MWEDHLNLPINIVWASLWRCAFSGHNADVAVKWLCMSYLTQLIRPRSYSSTSPGIAKEHGGIEGAASHGHPEPVRVYVELCPDFCQLQYLQALVIQLDRMNGYGLATKADHLIEDGLVIEETLLKTFLFRRRVEKIATSNLTFCAEDAEIIAALWGSFRDAMAHLKSSNHGSVYCQPVMSEKVCADDGHADVGYDERPTEYSSETEVKLKMSFPAWLFGVDFHPEAMKLTSMAKATIYKYHLGLELELCPDFCQLQYLQALVSQLTRMNGHGLATKADRLIEDGLVIEETLLKTIRRRVEKIATSNLPFCAEDAEIIAALWGMIVAVYACGVDVEKGPIRQQLWNAPPCDNVESCGLKDPGCSGALLCLKQGQKASKIVKNKEGVSLYSLKNSLRLSYLGDICPQDNTTQQTLDVQLICSKNEAKCEVVDQNGTVYDLSPLRNTHRNYFAINQAWDDTSGYAINLCGPLVKEKKVPCDGLKTGACRYVLDDNLIDTPEVPSKTFKGQTYIINICGAVTENSKSRCSNSGFCRTGNDTEMSYGSYKEVGFSSKNRILTATYSHGDKCKNGTMEAKINFICDRKALYGKPVIKEPQCNFISGRRSYNFTELSIAHEDWKVKDYNNNEMWVNLCGELNHEHGCDRDTVVCMKEKATNKTHSLGRYSDQYIRRHWTYGLQIIYGQGDSYCPGSSKNSSVEITFHCSEKTESVKYISPDVPEAKDMIYDRIKKKAYNISSLVGM
ncbi:IGF2R [Cordylochernes scorpioides]|uniref:IGF2R n=1 Tax=Cordylochernes scorpioides TaxID=51811 RepID=A0ABY6KJD9_9ARAC|nr:IGF2R [Cordylochernes scorpioides]